MNKILLEVEITETAAENSNVYEEKQNRAKDIFIVGYNIKMLQKIIIQNFTQ